jgi:type III pantothenate kinase
LFANPFPTLYYSIIFAKMKKSTHFLVIDAGNTRIKTGVFVDDCLDDFRYFQHQDLSKFKQYIQNVKYDEAILASVKSEKDTQWIKQLIRNVKIFNKLDKIPITNLYKTPETLGQDRLANVIAAYHKTKGNTLVLDIGTCIKFDFINAKGEYVGGSISPGIKLRYKALNEFTGLLPLLNETKIPKWIGKSTKECMHIGVIRGVQAEINEFIKEYQSNNEDLTIFVTGGDAQYFEFQPKSNIFAVENLTLEGLFITLKAYVQ